MAGKIFISYRREDAKAEARSIYQHLASIYGRDRIFMDVDSIQKGLDFTKVLEQSLEDTSVMLVLMGRTWLHAADERGERRLDDQADYVRLEIATALNRDIPIIPVRVEGARLPRIEELPDDIKGLVRRQGTVITHENFDSDVRGLVGDLAPFLPVASRAGRWPMVIGAVAGLLVAGGAAFWFMRPPAATNLTPQTAATDAAKSTAASGQGAASAGIAAAAAWSEAQRANTFEGYRAFMRGHPSSSRHKDAAEAAVGLLVGQIERRVDAYVATAKRRDGSLNGYVGGQDPRAMAMCVEWAGTSYDNLFVHTWGSSQFGGNTSMTTEERDKLALAFCNNAAPPAQRCTCEIAHRNGKAVLRIPPAWIAAQLR